MTYLLWFYSQNEGQVKGNNDLTMNVLCELEHRMTFDQVVYIYQRAYQSY